MNELLNDDDSSAPSYITSGNLEQHFYSEQRLRNILDQVNAGVAQTDADGKFIDVNDRYCQIVGYPKSELLQKTMMDITHPDDLANNVQLFRKCVEEGCNFFVEKRYVHKDGKYVWVNNSVSLITDGNGGKFLTAVTIDITEQKKAEKALRDSEERYQNFIRRSTEGIWRFELDAPMSVNLSPEKQIKYFFKHGFLAECNDAMARMYGFEKAAELTGTRISDFFPHDADTEAYFRLLIDSGYCLDGAESKEIDKNGNIKYFVNNLLGIVEDGMLIRCWGTQRDVSAQRIIEQKLRESEKQFQALASGLERVVEARTSELRRSNEDLQQFAHVASHDLKEPVRKVRMFGNRVLEEFDGILPPKAKHYLLKIESAAERMNTMIEGVLHYSSLNVLQEPSEDVDLNKVIENIQSDLEIAIQQKQARIQYEKLPGIKGMPILIYQLFYNLINNSLKFTRAGVAPLISIAQEINNDYGADHICISVRDNGIGFSGNEAQHIFDPFVRLHAKDMFEGTGLGLSLCRNIVERHGGKLIADGKEGEGANFMIFFPTSAAS